MPNPPNNNDLQREKVRFFNNSLSLNTVIKRGSVANSSRDNVVPPVILPTQSPTASNTPTPSNTPTLTPTVSFTPTQTSTVTPTLTITNTPTTTPTVTNTPTISFTPTITPTVTETPTLTPTITITPSVTPDYSSITFYPLTGAGQDILVKNIESYISPDLNEVNIISLNGLYKILNFNDSYDNTRFTYITKYQSEENIFPTLNGISANNLFEWSHEVLGNNTVAIFKGPPGLGSTTSILFSGYGQRDTSIPNNFVSGVKIYTDTNFNDVFARYTNSVSAIIIRGLTGTCFNTTASSVNGLVLNREYLDEGNFIYYYGDNLFYNVNFAYIDIIFGTNYWVLEIRDNADTFVAGFTGSSFFNSSTNLIPYTGMVMGGDYLENNFSILSSQFFQPNLQLLNANELFQIFPTPSPTLTPTITPSVTPTITVTPSITPTITRTPTITPSITPTISITPSITPTISITPSITITITPTKATPTPTPTSRTDTLPFSSVYLSAFGFYGNMGDVEYGISYDINAPVLLQKLAPPYDFVWQAYYESYNCDISLEGSPIFGWKLYLLQFGEYGFGVWQVASNSQSLSSIPLKNWTLSPGSSGGVIILNS